MKEEGDGDSTDDEDEEEELFLYEDETSFRQEVQAFEAEMKGMFAPRIKKL